jgi:hypothetical protein
MRSPPPGFFVVDDVPHIERGSERRDSELHSAGVAGIMRSNLDVVETDYLLHRESGLSALA